MILALCGRNDVGRDEAAVAVSSRVGELCGCCGWAVRVIVLGEEPREQRGLSSTAFLPDL